jgi:hypothetical protein
LCKFTPFFRHLKVIQVDLETAEFKDLLNVTLPTNCSPSDNIRPVISGDLLAQALYWYGALDDDHGTFAAILLIDWRSQKYVLFWYSRNEPIIFVRAFPLSSITTCKICAVQRPTIALAPGHIIFTTLRNVVVHSVAAIASRWRPIDPITAASLIHLPPRDIAPTRMEQIDFPVTVLVSHFWIPALALYRSPLRRDEFRLIVYQVGDVHQGRVFRPLQYAMLLIYRFSIAASSGNMVGWVRMSSSLAQLDVTSVSYAGSVCGG